MTTSKLIQVIKYFSLLTFLVSTAFVALAYFSPSFLITESIAVYILFFIASTITLLVMALKKVIFAKSHRREFLFATSWLLLNVAISFVYLQIFQYSLDTMLVKITNNTGDEVTEVYCFSHQWPRLLNGESRTVRLNCRYAIEHTIFYILNGKRRVEVLPTQGGIKYTYRLGREPRIAGD